MSCSSPYSAEPFGSRSFGHTLCVVAKFYWQLPLCMPSRLQFPNTVLIGVAAKRRHVEVSPTFSNASFRSHMSYMVDAMITDTTRSRWTLRPRAYENTDPTFIFIPTAHFLFLRLRECLLASASLCIGRLRKGISLCFPTAHRPLVTDISLLRTPLLSKPHVDPCITPHYDLLEPNMTYKDLKSWQ